MIKKFESFGDPEFDAFRDLGMHDQLSKQFTEFTPNYASEYYRHYLNFQKLFPNFEFSLSKSNIESVNVYGHSKMDSDFFFATKFTPSYFEFNTKYSSAIYRALAYGDWVKVQKSELQQYADYINQCHDFYLKIKSNPIYIRGK